MNIAKGVFDGIRNGFFKITKSHCGGGRVSNSWGYNRSMQGERSSQRKLGGFEILKVLLLSIDYYIACTSHIYVFIKSAFRITSSINEKSFSTCIPTTKEDKSRE